MKVFISWSGKTSHTVALALRGWLGKVIQAVDPYVSSEDTGKGTPWFSELGRQLETTDFGILCLTPQNISTPWILFEAGALSKSLDHANVSPLLIGLTTKSLQPPLAGFNATLTTRQDMKRLVKTINQKLGDRGLRDHQLNDAFETYWPQLAEQLEAAERAVSRYKYDVFLSAPMAALETDADYKKSRHEVEKVFNAFKNDCGLNVFWAAEHVESIHDFDAVDTSVIQDLRALKDSKYFVLLYPEKLVTSALFEAGYAIARKKFSVYFVTQKTDLPFLMRDAASVMSDVRLHTSPEWSSFDDIANIVRRNKTDLFLPFDNSI